MTHLVIFLPPVYAVLCIPPLLVWPDRGLSVRNLCLAAISAMLGLAGGFALMLALDEWIDTTLLLYVMVVVLPACLAFTMVRRFGNRGLCTALVGSLVYRAPAWVTLGAAIAIACGSVVFALSAWRWNGGKINWQLF